MQIRSILIPLIILFSSGCGILLGNVRPEDEKSASYGVTDLAKEAPTVWRKLDAASEGVNPKDTDATQTEVADVAYQNKKSSAIISLNSVCRTQPDEKNNLKEDAKLLFLGISEVTLREEMSTELQGAPALETTLQGKLNHEPVKLRAVVTRRKTCLYDLLYVSRPERFPENEADFGRFVSSLRLK